MYHPVGTCKMAPDETGGSRRLQGNLPVSHLMECNLFFSSDLFINNAYRVSPESIIIRIDSESTQKVDVNFGNRLAT
jgi:hypothetical protein